MEARGRSPGEAAEELHGVPVLDPHRPLEDGASPQTRAWTEAQNRRARAALDVIPGRVGLERRLADLLRIGTVGVPIVRGPHVFHARRTGDQDQAVLHVGRANDAPSGAVLVDPAALDPSGLTALDWWYPSHDGSHVAFGLSQGGDERSTLHVIRAVDGRWLDDAIPHTRAASVAWRSDGAAFYYTRRPAGDEYNMRVFLHRLGARWEDDEVVFGEGRAPEDWLEVSISDGGRWLIASADRGWSANDVYVRDLRRGDAAPFVPIAEGRLAVFRVHPDGDRLYIHTNEGAPRFSVRVVDGVAPDVAGAKLVVPETPDVLHDVRVARGHLALSYLHDAASSLRLQRLVDGAAPPREVPLPACGTVAALSARERSDELFVEHVSFTQPASIYRVDVASAAVSLWDRTVAPDFSRYVVEQHWFASRDGTRVPMFVVRAPETRLDGTAPGVLTAYGGFNVCLTPSFSPAIFPWLDLGGIYAVANVRGGGEFGEDWHRAGMLARKQNSFDDFIAAAEALGATRCVDPRRLAIIGGSNGGLLVAAAVTQRPELFAAAVCGVPLTDMLRFPRFLLGRLWTAEYGDPDDASDFATLFAYSPYHRVRDGVRYPAMLIVAAEHDSRVDPMHARKFGARLQAASSAGAEQPILVSIEADAGHGMGKPRWKQLGELVDRWSFLAWRLGVDLTRL